MPRSIGNLAPPPYMEAAPDGRQYFKVLLPYFGLAETFARAVLVRNHYNAIPNPEAKAKARLVALLIADLSDKVRAGQIATAEAADRAIRERIRATQVRPDRDSPLLINSIASRPILTSVFPTAAVGVADLAVLSQVSDPQGREYWKAQEWGSHHLVGKAYPGLFQPGDVAPSEASFRHESGFEVQGGAPLMLIRRPIPERAFLRAGSADAELFRYRLNTKIATDAIGEIERILRLRGPDNLPGTSRRKR